MAVLLTCTAVAVGRAQTAGGQAPEQPPVTFRAETNVVEVDAFVTDAAGAPVTGLTSADFEVLEDGKPQQVTAFTSVSIPITRADQPLFSPQAVEADVESNQTIDGRIYLIVLDDLHVDVLRTSRVKAIVKRFIERNLGANDLAAVVFTGGRSKDAQEFTSNKRLLQASVDTFIGRKLRSPTLAKLDQFNRTAGLSGTAMDPDAFQRGYDARTALQSVERLAGYMAGLHGRRKALVYVSEGIDYDIYNLFDTNLSPSDVIDATRSAVAAATRGNVSIYALDPRGLHTVGADLIDAPTSPDDDRTLGLPALQDELRMSQDSLRALADQTGGFAAINQNDLDATFDRIVRENSTYYVLGYTSANDRRDGRFRKLLVRVKRPGLTVRARSGYVAPRGKAAPAAPAPANPLEEALSAATSSPLATGGIPMRIFTAPFKGTAPNATVLVSAELDVRGLTFAPANGTSNNRLGIVLTVVDADGKVRVNERSNIDLTLTAPTLSRAIERGFRVTSAMNVPPGKYRVRLSVAEQNGKAGSVVQDVAVPDFTAQPLVMSGLTVSSASGAQAPTARLKDDPITQVLMTVPTAMREFARDDRLLVFAEVYENARNTQPHAVELVTEVRADGGTVVFNSREQRSSTELQGGRGGYGYRTEVPLGELAPGLYVVHVEARSSASSTPAGVGRDVVIRVR
jgi:VWFA-related protein